MVTSRQSEDLRNQGSPRLAPAFARIELSDRRPSPHIGGKTTHDSRRSGVKDLACAEIASLAQDRYRTL